MRGSGIKDGEVGLPSDKIDNGPKFNNDDLFSLIAMGFPEVRCKRSILINNRALIKTNHSGADPAMAWLCEHMEDPDIDDPIASAEQSKEIQFNSSDLNSLISMGFSEDRCKRSLINTNHNGAEAAMSWLFEHMEDSTLDSPLDTTVTAEQYSESDIAQLTDMGFAIPQARKALKETGNDMTRAVDWLFSHPGDSGNQETETKPLQLGYDELIFLDYDTKSADYELFAFISHKGTSAHCGHYVAYIKKS